MAKQLAFEAEARERLRSGVEKLARAVKATLGPGGRNAMLEKGWGSPTVTKDGVSVAEEIDLQDPYENLGAKLLRETASKTSDTAGDGTTTATVLAESLFTRGLQRVIAGTNAMALSRGIRKSAEAVTAHLTKQARKVQDAKAITQTASVAANNDASIGKIIADAMDKVGKDGVITVEEGKTRDTTVKIVEGMQFDRGFLSPHFVTNVDRVECVLEDPYILVHEDKISSAKKLLPLLEKIASSGKPLLILAEEVDGEALATLVVNKLRGTLQGCAVKAPGYGDRRKAMLQDIAILTGAKPYFKDLGLDLEKIQLSDLGRAKKITVTSEETTILQGAGKAADVSGRAKQIRREIEETTSDYDREKLQERLAKLTGGVAQIQVGASTESEMKERKARVEDALHATRAAVEEGILPGGGVALVRAQKALDGLKLEGDEAFAVDLVRHACEAPLRGIAANAGLDGGLAVRRVREGKGAFGLNAATGQYVDLFEEGIVDPCKVTRNALQNAVSVATLLLTSECLVTDIPKEEDEDGHGHGPGGMDGMGGGMGGGMGMGGF